MPYQITAFCCDCDDEMETIEVDSFPDEDRFPDICEDCSEKREREDCDQYLIAKGLK